jgi:hypothetical protein
MKAIGIVCAAAIAFVAGAGPSQAQDYQWRARATGQVNNVWTLQLKKLNGDGTGRLVGKTKTGQEYFFDFDVGRGPRPIRQTSTVTGCRYLWSPAGDVPNQVQDQTWRARATVENGSASYCGFGFVEEIVIKNGVMKATGEANNVWTLYLKGLNGDGSGRIAGKTNTGREF